MSAGPEQQALNVSQIEQARRNVNRVVEEIARLSEQELAPAEYYGEFLARVLSAIDAPAGAVWVRNPQGNLLLQYQVKMREVGLDSSQTSRQVHDELLRQAVMKGQPGIFPPQSGSGSEKGPGNPTNLFIILAPIIYDKQIAGLVEVWQNPMRGPDAMRNFQQFLVNMAALAAGYTRNHQLRQMVGQQQVWVQLENFARQIHGSLNPIEVAYLVVNEGRRLIEADRVSVAMRFSRKPTVEAISGADVVEKRSNLVQLMRRLFEEVMRWGERLVYSGTKDDSLPPAVLKALDLYLAESNAKLLVLQPLQDERETKGKKKPNPPRSALMMECFEPTATAEQLLARMEVVGRHSTSALYNAVEHRRIPFRFVWMPIAKLQEGLGGKTKAIVYSISAAVVLLLLAMVFVPYPLKMEAKGKLVPIVRQYLYAPIKGRVVEIVPKSGDTVGKNMPLLRLFSEELQGQIKKLKDEIVVQQNNVNIFAPQPNDGQAAERAAKKREAQILLESKKAELEALYESNNADRNNPGDFWIVAPFDGLILTPDFRETLKNRYVQPNEPLLRVGKVERNPTKRKSGEFELELKIPQKHIGQVNEAHLHHEELDVDMLVTSVPTRVFKGKLHRDRVALQANLNRDDPTDPEQVVLAWVRLSGPGIDKADQIPPQYLLTDIEVRTRIRCGNHAMGYSLFYGVWEFLFEKVIFFSEKLAATPHFLASRAP